MKVTHWRTAERHVSRVNELEDWFFPSSTCGGASSSTHLSCFILFTKERSNMLSEHDAVFASLAHLEHHKGIPKEVMSTLLKVEVNCRAHNGHVRPIVQVDDSPDRYDIPANTVVIDFLMECLRRHAADHVYCCLLDEHGNLGVAYVGKTSVWSALCPLQHHGGRVVLGDWTVKREHAAQVEHNSQVRLRRNAPCSCGSGMKYKKCCGSRRQQPSSRDAHESVTEEEFASQLVAAIRHTDATSSVAYDPDRSMLLRDGKPYLNLLNIFWEFSTAPVSAPARGSPEVREGVVHSCTATPRIIRGCPSGCVPTHLRAKPLRESAFPRQRSTHSHGLRRPFCSGARLRPPRYDGTDIGGPTRPMEGIERRGVFRRVAESPRDESASPVLGACERCLRGCIPGRLRCFKTSVA